MNCPECGGALRERKGSNGNFYGCSNYPKCKYTQSMESGVDKFIKKQNQQTAHPLENLAAKQIQEEGKIGLAIDRAVEYCEHTHNTDAPIETRKAEIKDMAEFFFYLPDQLKDHSENLDEEI